MTWAPQETQISIYNLFANDGSLSVLLNPDGGTTSKIFDHVPDGQPFPFISMDITPFRDRGSYTNEGWLGEIWIHSWYQAGQNSVTGLGKKQVQLIQARVDRLLHNTYLAISGWRNLNLRRAMVNVMQDPDNVTMHGIQQFKIMLGG